ncbi:hypothetical protein JET18_03760 [Chryseobacterium sp. L7]|uniref:Uncharacterized protein n=1 Tax=Chryseobacterium endalhagicum TaxID=2797638 RepID=A0ABS1QBF2_9FLAO|nr:hypothetical protein [Chryseobacterium endalhagicum]MBL1219938.1 hypothetical protein [Chryseobacterium endalhagicum]
MKKTFLFAIACFFFLTSCNNESIPAAAQDSLKTEAIQNFKRAITTVNTSKNLPLSEEKQNPEYPFPQLSEKRKDILVPAAKSLIKSTGVKEEEIEKATQGDKTKIILWAMEIFHDNYTNSSF